MAAAAQLFGIHELVEDILLRLPLRQILLSQRVSSSFRNVIETSYKIQQVLFYKPSTTSRVCWYPRSEATGGDPVAWWLYVGIDDGAWILLPEHTEILPIRNPFLDM